MRITPSRRGLSLVETMLASTILCICMGCILIFLPTGFISLKDSERRLYASSLAQRTLEEKRNAPLEALDALGTQPVIVEEVDYDHIHYTVTLTVRRHPSASFARKLQVTVDWVQHKRLVRLARESTECRIRR